MQAQLALAVARAYRDLWGINRDPGPWLEPRIEYALRRIGGLRYLDRELAFVAAFNEAPFVDVNENSP